MSNLLPNRLSLKAAGSEGQEFLQHVLQQHDVDTARFDPKGLTLNINSADGTRYAPGILCNDKLSSGTQMVLIAIEDIPDEELLHLVQDFASTPIRLIIKGLNGEDWDDDPIHTIPW